MKLQIRKYIRAERASLIEQTFFILAKTKTCKIGQVQEFAGLLLFVILQYIFFSFIAENIYRLVIDKLKI